MNDRLLKKNIATFIINGVEKVVEFIEGETVLDLANRNQINLSSSCDGSGICGQCVVNVMNLLSELNAVSDAEQDTLQMVSGSKINSRLACQIKLYSKLSGIIFLV